MKTFLDINGQIARLKSLGMTIEDENKAKEVLSDIGFYRLGFYAFPFEKTFPKLDNRDHQFVPGTTFNSVLELYYFDFDLRILLLYYLNRIEVNIRSQITYIVSTRYPQWPTWFVNPNVMTNEYIANFDKTAYNELRKYTILQRHHVKYINDKYAPAWKTLEFMTLGNICFLYSSIRDRILQKEIASHYKCSFGVFCNYMEIMRLLRNRCAHGSFLYSMTLIKGVKTIPANIPEENRHNIAGVTGVVQYLINQISHNRLNDLNKELDILFNVDRSNLTKQIIAKCTGFKV